MSTTTPRQQWSTRTVKKFAEGKKARAICDRSGMEYPMDQMVLEPGTNLLVHHTMTDGEYNIVDHPQNFPPRKLGDSMAIENPRVDREFENWAYVTQTGEILQVSDTGDNYEFEV